MDCKYNLVTVVDLIWTTVDDDVCVFIQNKRNCWDIGDVNQDLECCINNLKATYFN